MLRLGIIGLSEGNGHPYSWSAICNGYRADAMEACGFPAIPRYLEKESWPEARLKDVSVTHVWTQERERSEHIAHACYIDHVVDHPSALIGAVDGILLARDDAENHVAMALPFIEAGLPIYIDKPICLSMADLYRLLEKERYSGQIFSCSALRYASELQLSALQREQLGSLQHIQAVVPKDWSRYAVHILEPMLLMLDPIDTLVDSYVIHDSKKTSVTYHWQSGFTADVVATGTTTSPIAMRILGENSWLDLQFVDAFSAFKKALAQFIESIATKQPVIDSRTYPQVVELIERGMP